MKTLILRADDISAFSSPALLDKIYGRFWQANLPVSLAVIPQPRGDARLPNSTAYHPSIPPQKRGSNQPYKLRENKILCLYLNELARQGLVEICLGGYDHSAQEFASEDETLLAQKIEEGKAELETAFPAAEIKTFIAPDATLSQTAFNLLVDYGFHICTPSPSLKGTDYAMMDNDSRHDLANEQKLFTADTHYFPYQSNPTEALALAQAALEAKSFLIIPTHYWAFYQDWAGHSQEMQAAWQTYVDSLLALKKVKFTSFGMA